MGHNKYGNPKLPPFGAKPDFGKALRDVVKTVNGLVDGRSNNSHSLTLGTGTSTTLNHQGIAPYSEVFLFPKTSAAAGDMSGTYVSSIGVDTVTITHPANASTRIVSVVWVG
jgi:hypothetical protein